MFNLIKFRSGLRGLVNAHLVLFLPPYYWLLVEAVPLILTYFAIPVAIVLLQARKRQSFFSLNNLKLSTLALLSSSGVGIFVTYSNLPEVNVGIDFIDGAVKPFLILFFILIFYGFILNDLFAKEVNLAHSGKYISTGLVLALSTLALPFVIGWARHDTFNLDLLLLNAHSGGNGNPLPLYLHYYKLIGGSTTIGPICAVLIVFAFIFFEKRSQYLLRLILFVGFFFILALCQSRSALLACVVGLSVLQLRRQPIYIFLMAVVVLVGSLLLIAQDLRTGVNIIDKLLFSGFGEARSAVIFSLFRAMSFEQFLFGFGYESLRFYDVGLKHAHNLFLSVYFDQGFFGLCLLFWFLGALYSVRSYHGARVGDQTMRFSLLSVGLICFCFDTTLFRSSFSFLSVFLTVFLIVCHGGRGMLIGRS